MMLCSCKLADLHFWYTTSRVAALGSGTKRKPLKGLDAQTTALRCSALGGFYHVHLVISFTAAGGQEALQPVEAMLAVASYPANAIAEMSYSFWFRLQRSLTTSFGSERAPSLQACAYFCNFDLIS